jgi:hypothetical protein
MNPREIVRGNAEKLLIVDSLEIPDHVERVPKFTDKVALNGKLIAEFQLSWLIGTALLLSGIFHLALLWISGAEWSGPLSLRKPGLFGFSAGVTAWSIVWVLTQFERRPYDRLLANLMSISLLLEVGLITLQMWRGVPSHFHRATTFDATIESIMLGLILFVTAGIAWLCWRSRQLQPMPESRMIAIRGGLWLLLVSCGLGLLVTIAGEMNLANGQPPEGWGHAGVLKYPHGAALHAIQTLPMLSVLMQWFRVAHCAPLIRAAVAAHVLFLTHALWQTFHGRARLDVDLIGGITLAMAGLLIALPLLAIIYRAAVLMMIAWFGRVSVQKSS